MFCLKQAQTWHEAMASGSKAAMEAMACDGKAKEVGMMG